MHFAYIRRHFLLLDEPRIPPITIEALTMYHIPFEHTPWCDIHHIIIYHAYFGFERLDNPLWFVRHFFENDANGRATRSTFYQDTTIKVYEDVGDFIENEDLTPFEIAFY